ncbi:MAG TPA: alpha/beta hydrolase [Rubrivivax sp.]|nr:alpha/beta hydrolase [Rubrivivax sp.]
MSPLPPAISSLADLAAVAAAARVRHTPCGGTGALVWHAWGDASDAGRPVLLLHGGAGSWTHWVRNIAALRRAGRSVWVPDLPGFGASALPPGCLDADQLPPWLGQGLQRLLGERALDVVGFSFGGLVGGYLAQSQPARVASLMLVGAPALGAERRAPLPLRRWSSVPAGARRDAIHRHNLRTLMLAHEDAADALAIAIHGANVERDRMRRRRLMLTDALRRMLPGIACPLAGIWGERDVLYLGREPIVAEALRLAPHFRRLSWVPGAGHWVVYEDAAAFDALLGAWLDEVAPPGTDAARHPGERIR